MKKISQKNRLTKHQKEIFDKITHQLENIIETGMNWDNVVALSGAAGTGKTFLTKAIVEHLHEKYSVTITAPTHKALSVLRDQVFIENLQVPAKTIHSFLNIKLFTDYDKGIQKFVPEKSKTDVSKTDILIVDESSMISSELYEFIQNAIESERIKAVLFVGDYYQLLPVDSKKNSVFNVRHQYKLKEIVRQAEDSYIITIASAAREIIKSADYVDVKTFFAKNQNSNITFFHNQNDFLEDFCHDEEWYNKDKVITSYKNSDVDSYNRMVREKYWLAKGVDDIPTLLKGDKVIFQSAYSINGVIKYHNNEQITLSYAKKMYSDILKIEYWECKDDNEGEYQELIRIIDPKSISLFNDKLDKISKMAKNEKNYKKRKEMWKTFFELKEYFANVKYIFASTIHKLQGSTYETVYIDLFSLANNRYIDYNELYRLIYVAITRASKDIKILIPALNEKNIKSIEISFEQLFGDLNF